MTKDEMVQLAREIAIAHSLPPEIICGIVEHESSWNQWAIRYEPKFLSKYVAPLFTNNKISATEAYTRSMSWGLMQVMGQTARELGFDGQFLPELCDPSVGIEWGCRKLVAALKKNKGDLPSGLLGYNGGDNSEYPTEVILLARNYKI